VKRAPSGERPKARGGWRGVPDKPMILALLGLSAVLMFATISAEPIITVHVERLTGTDEGVAIFSALVFSLSALGTILSGPWLGRLADRIGHLRVLSYSLLAATILLAAQWLALGGITPTVVATIRRMLPDASVGLVLGYNVSAQYIGQVSGPIVAGALGGAFGTSSVFVMTSAATLVGLLVVVLIRRHVPSRS
jgi:MFS family permease